MYKSKKDSKVFNVYISTEEEPINFLATNFAEVVRKTVKFMEENNLITSTIKKIEEVKLS